MTEDEIKASLRKSIRKLRKARNEVMFESQRIKLIGAVQKELSILERDIAKGSKQD